MKKEALAEKGITTSEHPTTVVFGGFARLPANAVNIYGVGSLSIEIEIDPYDMRIVDVACNCLPPLGEKMLVQAIVGEKVDKGFEKVISVIRHRYFSVAQRAMIAALEDLEKQICRYIEKES